MSERSSGRSGPGAAARTPTKSTKAKTFFCRICIKYLVPSSEKGTVQRANLFTELKNKEFTTLLGLKNVVLNDILKSWGCGISKEDDRSKVVCMSCARTLVRTYSTWLKLIKNLKESEPGVPVVIGGKRISPLSPFKGKSPLTSVEKKRARLQNLQSPTAGTGKQNIPVLEEEEFYSSVGVRPMFTQRLLGMDEVADSSNKENADQHSTATELNQQIREKISLLMNIPGEGDGSGVKVFVGYPSGKVIEHESSMKSEKKLLRAMAKKDIKTAVNAILHTKAYQPFLRAGFCKILSGEAVQYFTGKNCLKMEKSSSPSEISKLSIDELEFELQNKMPVTFQFLEFMTGARARKLKDQRRAARIKKQSIKKTLPASGQKEFSPFKLRREKRCRNTVCNVASMCLRQYFPNMSKLAYRNTLLLLNGGCRSLDVDRLNMHGFTMSHSSAIQMQSKMAQEIGKDALEWKDEVENMAKMMILMTEVGEKHLVRMHLQLQFLTV